jgi:hypothetical protein
LIQEPREDIPSVEADELASAKKRIAALEAELKLTRDACELFDAQAVVSPKGGLRSSKGFPRSEIRGGRPVESLECTDPPFCGNDGNRCPPHDSQDRGRR